MPKEIAGLPWEDAGAQANRSRAVFRAEAVQRYLQGQNHPVAPRIATPHAVFYLWILLWILIAGGSLIGFALDAKLHAGVTQSSRK